jgi:branched-chain amino acid transport system substrate-binding protein
MKHAIFSALLPMLLLCFLSCSGGGREVGNEITIGVPLPLTGQHAKFGQMEEKAYRMAEEDINAAGGVLGKKLRLIIEDTAGDPQTARSVVENFISVRKIPFIVGGYSSAETKAIANLCNQYKVPYLVVTGAADEITQHGWEYVFRLCPPSSAYAQGLADFLEAKLKPNTMAILHEQTDFGTSTAAAMERWCNTHGVDVVLKESYEAGAIDFKPLLGKVKAKEPDVVFMVSYLMDASKLMANAKEIDMNPKLFAGGAAGFTLPEFLVNAGDASDLVVSGTLWTPEVNYPGAKEFFAAFKDRYGSEPDYHGTEAYAAVQVLADVLGRAESRTSEAIRAALADTDMMTIFGPVKFVADSEFTNQNRLPTLVLQVIDGRFETIWPEELASADAVCPVPPWSER